MDAEPGAAQAPTGVGTPLWKWGGLEMAAAMRSGEVSARDVVVAMTDRIDEVNGQINAVVHLEPDALDRARDIDAARARGEELPIFAGVPISIKAEIDVAGSPTTSGAYSQRNVVPGIDAPSVQRLRAAGAIVLARTNEPDFGTRLHTDSSLYGRTTNPWDPALTTGGSSGGDAAALATGMIPLGIGSDIGGSLRNPATCCGVAALKPGLGRIPVAYENPTVPIAEQLMCVQGPMARHVRDLRAALTVMEGPDPRDAWSLDVTPAEQRAGGKDRIAVATCDADPEVAAAVRTAADALSRSGYDVVEASPPLMDELFEVWVTVLARGSTTGEPAPEPGKGVARFGALVQQALQTTLPGVQADDALAVALSKRHSLGSSWARHLDRTLVLGPVWTTRPWPVDYDITSADAALDVLRRARLALAANVLGLPAVTVPAAVDRGVPIGIQLIGPRASETRCLGAAEAVESALGVIAPITPRIGAAATTYVPAPGR